MKLQLPRSARNWISLTGAIIALISFSMIVFLLVISAIWRETHVYLGIVTYILLPAVMMLGLVLIPVGMWVQVRRNRRREREALPPLPILDLNNPRHRNAFVVFAVGTAVFLFFSAVGSYEAYHYTESVEFCGQLCHEVMKPDFTAYQHYPHARVACVECHVGAGANWYLRSKLYGLRRVYLMVTGKYARPIPAPIENLRPARETCEQCHWPERYYAQKFRLQDHFKFDEENTPWKIGLLMRIGSPEAHKRLEEGTHWHNNPAVQIDYIARDAKREDIPYVRYTNLNTGETVIYQDEEEPLDPSEIRPERMRRMDCMDCHNRSSHDFRTPIAFVNEALAAGLIPRQLPEIKSLAVGLCEDKYPTEDSARTAIEKRIREFYQEEYPEIVETHPEWVDQAVEGMQKVYSRNIFPEMNADWKAYPNHLGHLDSNGCFRCHSGRHVSEDGERSISKDCNLCHYIVLQGPADELSYAAPGRPLEFRHPDDEEDWKDGLCTDCHEGVEP
ncbi:MAG: cytochrome C [Calditrichaeota bacterium]|nr:MAG: cytochrome C [Calditrichota bacterium]